MKTKIEKSTYWFLITALCNFLYFPIVHLFLKNPNIGERFKDASIGLYASYIYIVMGILWLIFGLLYIASDYSEHFKFTRQSKLLHFCLIIGFTICLMLVPILETYYPLSDTNRNGWFPEIFTIILSVSVLAFFVGMILFIVNLIKAFINSVTKL